MNKEIIYQIYPKSYNDSNNDGFGDLTGITRKLDYLDLLDIDTLWLLPIFPRIQNKMNYAVSDFFGIDPIYGTMTDFEILTEEANDRDMSILLDINFYETSIDCLWFQKALAGDPSYKNYYFFSSSPEEEGEWVFHETADVYYQKGNFENTAKCNLENPFVQEQFGQVLNFWAQKGVCGFAFENASRIQDKTLQKILSYVSTTQLLTIAKSDLHFSKFETKMIYPAPFDMSKIATYSDYRSLKQTFLDSIREMQNTGVITTWYLNHPSTSRAISTYGDDTTKSGKMLATLVHMMPGVPVIYQGEEIGMTNADYTSIEEYNDADVQKEYAYEKEKMTAQKAFEQIKKTSFLNSCTPMQWTDSKYADFSDVKPWLMTNQLYKRRNAERMIRKVDSIFYHYKDLIDLRKTTPCISGGDFQVLDSPDEVFAFERKLDDRSVLVVLNLSDKEVPYRIPSQYEDKGILLSNCSYKRIMEPFDALIIGDR